MKPTMEILARINQDSRRNKEEIFTRLYRYLLRPDIYYVAYQNLYANKGAGTKGTDNDTADGFSEKKIAEIIKSLSDETIRPNLSEESISKNAAVQRKNVLWESLHLQTSLYRKCSES